MTLLGATQTGRLREPGHMETGDHLYLREGGSSNELRRLAFMHLHDSVGEQRPLAVDSFEGISARIAAGYHKNTVAMPLSALTPALPLYQTVQHPFTPLENVKSIKR